MPPPPELTLRDGWRLRRWRRDDVANLVRYANTRALWLNMRDDFPHPLTPAVAKEWVRVWAAEDRLTDFALARDGAAVGWIGLRFWSDERRRTADLAYWVGAPYRGRGLATAAVEAVTTYAFEEFAVDRLEASVWGWNPASARVLEKAGFALEGRLRRSVTRDGRTTDTLVYAKLRREG